MARSLALTLAVLAVVLLATAEGAERHKRLTTFGKAPESQSKPGYKKECKEDKECPVDHSICREDYDGVKRCVCQKGGYPIDGLCPHHREKRGYVPKGNSQPERKAIGLREPCQSSLECIHGAECKINPNATVPHLMKLKVCLCTDETFEEDGECSGCSRIFDSQWMMFILSLTAMFAYHRDH